MSSRRERVPLTGRSNMSNIMSSNLGSARSSARSARSLTTERREQLNNPLEVFRPYSPEVTKSDVHLVRPPILPKSRYSSVPPPDPTLGVVKHKRKSICPADFITQNLAPKWYETVDQADAILNVDMKVTACREFVERNRDRLWKYDLKYMNRTPEEVADDMISSQGLLDKMKKYNSVEMKLKLSSSEQFTKSFSDNHLKDSKSIIKRDPFMQSMKTARADKAYNMTNLLQGKSGPETLGRSNLIGYRHAPEYGTFSNFNGLIQLNKNAILNR